MREGRYVGLDKSEKYIETSLYAYIYIRESLRGCLFYMMYKNQPRVEGNNECKLKTKKKT